MSNELLPEVKSADMQPGDLFHWNEPKDMDLLVVSVREDDGLIEIVTEEFNDPKHQTWVLNVGKPHIFRNVSRHH